MILVGWLFSGDEDVNITGVVGSSGTTAPEKGEQDTGDKSSKSGRSSVNEGVLHLGSGDVYINGVRQ